MYEHLTAECYNVLRESTGEWETMYRFDLMKLIEQGVPAAYYPTKGV